MRQTKRRSRLGPSEASRNLTGEAPLPALGLCLLACRALPLALQPHFKLALGFEPVSLVDQFIERGG